MSKNLVIVESPAKSKTIEKFLGKDYKVMASVGHIRDLPKSKMGIDVKNKFEPDYVISTDKKKVVNELKKAAKSADKIFIATDEDREGEAIGWHLLHILGIKKDTDYERIVFHEITKNAITKAIENPRKIDERLVNAQQTRRLLDRLVGYELSPILWKKIKMGLSAGRVQSVALRLIVEREEEIRKFKPVEYWKIKANVNKDKISWEMICDAREGEMKKLRDDKLSENRVRTEAEFKKIYEEIEGKNLVISKVETKESKRTPPAPFTTSTLQQAASTSLGFGVKQTMMIAQKLYEGIDLGKERVGLITYMRTDSTNLSNEALSGAKKTIESDIGKEYALSSPRLYKKKNKGAQEAHEAIRPVDFTKTPESVSKFLDTKELKLYTLIYNRTLQTQMKEAIVNVTNLLASPKGTEYLFKAKGEQIVFDGWMKLGKPAKELILPKVDEKEELDTEDYNGEQNFTKPPARYSEASLVKELEKKGIGRPSTYAPTISTIQARDYVVKENPETKEKWKYLVPTEIGELVTNFLKEHFADVVDYDFTARVEEDLDEIAEGNRIWDKVLKDIYDPFHKNIEEKKKTVEKVQEKTGKPCPKCGKDLIYKFSRMGKFISCSDYPECDYTDQVKEEKEAVAALEKKHGGKECSKCSNGTLNVKKGKFGYFLGCSNYPECKNMEAIVNAIGLKCPACKTGDIIEKNTRFGKKFWGCKNYPKCKFASWVLPTEDNLDELLEKHLNPPEKKTKKKAPAKKKTTASKSKKK